MGGGWTNLAMVEMPVWFETWPEVKTSAAALHTDDKARYRLVLCLRDPHCYAIAALRYERHARCAMVAVAPMAS